MPLAKRTFDIFWDNQRPGNQADILWNELMDNGIVSGDINIPGDSIIRIETVSVANPFISGSTITLDGRKSLFAASYLWSVESSPGPATSYQLTDANTPLATFGLTGTQTYGSYTFRLTIENSSGGVVKFKDIDVTLVDARVPLDFSDDIYLILTDAAVGNCIACHATPGSGGFDTGGNNLTTYNEVTRRVDLLNPANSLLLRKATGLTSHGGGVRFSNASPEYNTIFEWIDVDNAAGQ